MAIAGAGYTGDEKRMERPERRLVPTDTHFEGNRRRRSFGYRLYDLPPECLDRIAAEREAARRWLKDAVHRSKNHLQMLSAIMDILADGQEGGAVPADELAMAARVAQTLAGAEQKLLDLYLAGESGGRPELGGVLSDIVLMYQDLVPKRPILLMTSNDVTLGARKVSAVCVVVAELLVNAIKYGGGNIDVCLARSGDDVVVTVRDYGQGTPADTVAPRGGGMGTELTRLFAEHDLRGSLEVGNDPEGGVRATLTFPCAH